MFVHYHAKQINAERVGGRMVRVVCTRCGCEFFYKFTRIGKGSSQAPYGLGVDRATRKANEKAQKDLDRRLASEAELVPCPKCNWVNDELVAGFRRGSYRRLGAAAALIAAAGVAIGIVIGFAFGFTAPAVLPYALIIPTVLLVIGGGLLLLRAGLRGRIRPNQDHPLPPKLPPGSPPALLKDPESGKFVLARQEPLLIDAAQDWCDFQIGRHNWPLLCCDCLQPTPLHGGHRLKVTTTLRLTIPRCSDCSQSAERHYRRFLWNGTLAAIIATAVIVLPFNLDWLEFGLITAALLIVSLGITIFVARKMTAPARIAGGDRSRGVVRLRFRNADYARAVAARLEA
jgi:hypothetical protein